MIKVVLASDSTVTVAGKAIVVQYCNNARGACSKSAKSTKTLKFYAHVEYLLSMKKGPQFLRPYLTDVEKMRFELTTS